MRRALLATLALITLAACSSEESSDASSDETGSVEQTDPDSAPSEPPETEPAATETEPIATETEPIATETEPVATEPEPQPEPDEAIVPDGPCEPADDEGIEFISLYWIVAGELGPLCFGVDDPVARGAWDELATVAPTESLTPISTYGSFLASGDEIDTLAFVTVIDEAGTEFEMAVNTEEAEADPTEMALTMTHELTHVFTATPDQLDRTVFDECVTYFNGEGCYIEGSIMDAWILTFWDQELLATVDPFTDSPDDADARCAIEPSFFGSYGATNPEEDFAEAFAAFVYRVEATNPDQQDKLDWLAGDPALDEFRIRAIEAGRGPLDYEFDPCG